MKRVTDFLHSKGKFCELHSCGQNFKQVPNFIKAGWDMWVPQAMNDTQGIYEAYGDKIVVAVIPDPIPENATEDEQRAAARSFVDRFMQPGKCCVMSYYNNDTLTDAYMEELYSYSRQKAYDMSK